MRFLLGLLVAAFFLAPRAEAVTCTFAISTLDFGDVDTLSGGAHDRTATLSINCTNVTLGTVRICPNIGAGTGGSSGSARYMRNPSNAPLEFSLFTDTGTTPWGSIEQALLGTPPTIDLTTSLFGSISTTRTIYGRVSANQQTAQTGHYSSQFTAAHSKISYSDLTLFNCLTLASPVAVPFEVKADVQPNCLVTADNINFGTRGVLRTNVDAAGAVNVRCTPGTSYSVGLNGGLANAAPTARQMKLGSAIITYGLYLNTQRNQPWSQAVGQIASGTGTGLLQSVPVYGRVPAQTTPGAGIYSDTVVATVTY